MEAARRRPRTALFLTVVFGLSTWGAMAGGPPKDICSAVDEAKRFKAEEASHLLRRLEILSNAEAAGVQAAQPLDVLHYDLDLRLDPAGRTIQGTVTMSFHPTQALSHLKMRLHKDLSVSEIRLDGIAMEGAKHKRASIKIAFDPPLLPDATHEISVTYNGRPPSIGSLDGGMMFASHQGVPSATTLSEPFASYAWWPCIDDLSDKCTMDMELTVPPGMVGASNGMLVASYPNPDGWTTYHWSEAYPLSNYLISANVTNYATFSDSYLGLDGSTTMPLDYFVYPEHQARAMVNVVAVPDMIRLFASLVGEYPFLAEKYGMVEFPWGGGMEHQTLTSMGDAYLGGSGDYEVIYAHELAHQWWGDDVTCGTWNDIWLNEGFATYFEILWLAHSTHLSEGYLIDRYYDDHQWKGYMGGAVYMKNGNRPFDDTGAVYDKGAWILHMLRRVMGEGPFWQALKAYRVAHAYGNATTADFQSVCEAAYGEPLDWFFDQWVYTPKRPIYSLSFSQEGSSVVVTLSQRQKQKVKNRTADRNVYLMPIDLTLHCEDGTSQTFTVHNDQRRQTFAFQSDKPIVDVGLDEDHWILKVER